MNDDLMIKLIGSLKVIQDVNIGLVHGPSRKDINSSLYKVVYFLYELIKFIRTFLLFS